MAPTLLLDSLSMNGHDNTEGITPRPDPVRVNGGDGTYSYNKNSYYQRLGADAVKEKIHDAITRNLDVNALSSSASNTIRIADLGCAVGPNTIISMQNVLQAIKNKYNSQCSSPKMPEFQVFLNDKKSNDFNTLFTSLPDHQESQDYFAAGVPGSFHHRLFPESCIHFVHCSFALHWLSKVPEELLDMNSPAWNKGRIHYACAPDDVLNAYASQFDKDMISFLNARAKEVVTGGMMVLIMPGIPFGMPYSRRAESIMYDLMASIFMDMTKEGSISEAELDSFNLPIYTASPEEMVKLVERNGCFSIQRIELTDTKSLFEAGPVDITAWTMHVRAAMEGMFTKHFGLEIVDQMFDRLIEKLVQSSDQVESSYKEKYMLFAVLIRNELYI